MLSLGFEIKLSSWNAYYPANIISHIKDNHCFYYCKHRMRLEVKLPISDLSLANFDFQFRDLSCQKGHLKRDQRL